MYKIMMGLARNMAILGGFILTLLVLLTCASIVGRILNSVFHGDLLQSIAPGFSTWMTGKVGPINGDFELVEAGVAFAIFAFLPLCQITGGHAAVDILVTSFSARVNRWLRLVSEALFAAVLVLIAWRLALGTLGKFDNGETSFLLEFPVWWAYAASLFAAVIAALTGVYMAGVRLVECMTGRIQIFDGVEAEH